MTLCVHILPKPSATNTTYLYAQSWACTLATIGQYLHLLAVSG